MNLSVRTIANIVTTTINIKLLIKGLWNSLFVIFAPNYEIWGNYAEGIQYSHKNPKTILGHGISPIVLKRELVCKMMLVVVGLDQTLLKLFIIL